MIEIIVNQDKCLGYKECGLCVNICEESILVPDEETGKVKVDQDKKVNCDGLGNCLDVCPVDALTIICDDGKSACEHATSEGHSHGKGCSCPSSAPMSLDRTKRAETLSHRITSTDNKESGNTCECNIEPKLANWPVQLHLLSENAPYLKDAHLLVAADCVPFTYADFHNKLLDGKILAIGCPKLDEISDYERKIRAMVEKNNIKKVTVAIMEVPCCSSMYSLVKNALEGLDVEINKIVIAINGSIKE
ncbi:4Fe-4S dicluster domain-containing protein [Methanococcus voltae]|uniref:Ferredoxin n=1 Tax=Methanococcus voltae TaxID=2188 RepID=A0A8J7RHF5_METVO|nr:4Fe-4S dicluster domain-containing protein [Methanococcus voltae]MBP2172077.1 ferredoxin [Methanococcus voltae]MBP2200966.1 ferredoxin [Methanococcus voltae]